MLTKPEQRKFLDEQTMLKLITFRLRHRPVYILLTLEFSLHYLERSLSSQKIMSEHHSSYSFLVTLLKQIETFAIKKLQSVLLTKNISKLNF